MSNLGTPPRDYSVQAEDVRGHLLNALQLLGGPASGRYFESVEELALRAQAARDRVAAALALLETQP